MNFSFIAPGSSIKVEPKGKLYLDVGNRLDIGVIDHHQLKNTQKSATRLVYENPSLIPISLEEIVLHTWPDLDCIAASFLAKHYYEKKKFPEFSIDLCKFLDKVDFGFEASNSVNLGILFSLIKSNCNSELEIVLKGHGLIEKMASFGFDSGDYPLKYASLVERLKQEKALFQEDLKYTTKQEFKLLNRYTLKCEDIQALILKSPKSKLFKSLSFMQGVTLLIVHWSEKRTVISLKGDSYYTLEGVGDCLNNLEKEERKRLGTVIDEQNREGYDISDPWYDGRAHNYTIIDSPCNGTVLKYESILDSVKNFL